MPPSDYPLSPFASSITSTSTAPASLLPRMRAHPLPPGSNKEIAFIEHVDSRILQISRRYEKKGSGNKDTRDEAPGYDNFAQCAHDLEAVLNIVWVSGTPALQVPYLLSLAGLLSSYLPAFPFATSATFRLVKKLDAAFAHLLQPPSSVPSIDLPTHSVSATDKVRIKSLVSSTRVAAVDVAAKSGYSRALIPVELSDVDVDESDEESSEEAQEDEEDEMHDRVGKGLSRMYQQTVSLLGDALG